MFRIDRIVFEIDLTNNKQNKIVKVFYRMTILSGKMNFAGKTNPFHFACAPTMAHIALQGQGTFLS